MKNPLLFRRAALAVTAVMLLNALLPVAGAFTLARAPAESGAVAFIAAGKQAGYGAVCTSNGTEPGGMPGAYRCPLCFIAASAAKQVFPAGADIVFAPHTAEAQAVTPLRRPAVFSAVTASIPAIRAPPVSV